MAIHIYTRSIEINAPQKDVFHFHDDTNNLLKITPPSIKVKILRADPPGVGSIVKLKVTQFGFLTQILEMKFTTYESPTVLVDTQISGPFKSFVQKRTFTAAEKNVTVLTDSVEYELPFGFLGTLGNFLVVKHSIASMFKFRQNKTKQILENKEYVDIT